MNKKLAQLGLNILTVSLLASCYQPEPGASWQWQISGDINTAYAVDAYDVDLYDAPDAVFKELHDRDIAIICYFSAGSYEEFRDDASEFLPAELGNTLDGWPDERWLDIRSRNVLRIMLSRLDLAAKRGCDAVEPDNVDGYSNDTGFNLSAEDQLAFNRFIALAAHLRGLGVGLKNDLDQIEALVAHFDFSVNEQCHEFDECDRLQPFIDAGKAVFIAEYADTFVSNAAARQAMCESSVAASFSTLILPLDLDDSFRTDCAAQP